MWGSKAKRASINSNGFADWIAFGVDAFPSKVTYVPLPCLISTSPFSINFVSASRTVPRETP